MNSDEAAIRDVVTRWLKASAAGDVNSMLPMLADDMVFVVPGAPPFGKTEFKAAWDGPMKGARVDADANVEEVLIEGSFAVTRTRLSVAITTAQGQTSKASGYTMTLFRKQPNGDWVMARDANLLTPQK